ncbi:MAG TPA: GerMN domain-containing protein [Atribacteraceae bacterium]|nr:GerMN domain-containing protein [Atribacteraceae bacterium]
MNNRKRKRRKRGKTALLTSLLYILIGIGVFFIVVYAGEFVFREQEEPPPNLTPLTGETIPTPTPPTPAEEEEMLEVVLYFANDQFTALVGERREVVNEDKLFENVIHELLAGPHDTSLFNPIPATVTLNGVFAEGGTVYTDLSRDMIDGQMGGASQELLSIFCIVNTLTGLTGVDRVKILIDGKEEVTLRGHIDISEPLERDEKIIAKIQ